MVPSTEMENWEERRLKCDWDIRRQSSRRYMPISPPARVSTLLHI
jgi:hypothetical protein